MGHIVVSTTIILLQYNQFALIIKGDLYRGFITINYQCDGAGQMGLFPFFIQKF